MIALQPVIINEGSAYLPIFSREFILEFFRRYLEDPVLFPLGRVTVPPYSDWNPEQYAHVADDTLVPGWTAYALPCPSFLHKETGEWLHSFNMAGKGESWRTDDRFLALLREKGRGWSGSNSADLRINYAPMDMEWWVDIHENGGGETVHCKLPYEQIIAELVGLLRRTGVGDLHPLTRRVLEEGMTLTDLETEIYAAVKHANDTDDLRM
jgi:hypothetical protein